jgi:hypothetical protein
MVDTHSWERGREKGEGGKGKGEGGKITFALCPLPFSPPLDMYRDFSELV